MIEVKHKFVSENVYTCIHIRVNHIHGQYRSHYNRILVLEMLIKRKIDHDT